MESEVGRTVEWHSYQGSSGPFVERGSGIVLGVGINWGEHAYRVETPDHGVVMRNMDVCTLGPPLVEVGRDVLQIAVALAVAKHCPQDIPRAAQAILDGLIKIEQKDRK